MLGSEDMVKVLKSDGSPTELSPEEEKCVITELTWQAEGQVKEGDTFYLISRRWWRIWTAFAYQNLRIRTNDGSSSEHQGSGSSNTLPRPSSIDNSDLICGLASDSLTPVIHNTLIEGTDYILVPEAVWNQFYAWYGGGPAIPRKAISCGSSQTELTIEVYPLRLRLHVIPHGYRDAIRMSKKETIGALRRKACEIFHLNSDQVRIWDYFSGRKHGLLNELVKTLEDANIQMDQDILVEVFDHSGGCRGVIQENGPAGKGTLVLLEPSKRNHLITAGYFVNNGASSYCYLDWSQFQNLAFATRLSDNAPAPVGARTRGSYGGLIGLLNFGNTCFMNTAIQCLVHTPEFIRYFHGDFLQEINWHNPLGMMGELAMAFGDLLRKLWTPGPCAFVPRTFKAKLARFAPQFGGYNQHDCQELLAFLLDGLHEDLNRVKDKPYIKSTDADGRPDEQVADEYWANHIARNDSVIVDVCQGQYKSTLICPVCDKKSITFDPFMYLSLPLQSTTRTMTVTVFSCDGSVLPTTCTVTVPKQGRCGHLIQALSSACSIKKNEKILLAEIQDNLIHRFLEDPLMSLSAIKDDDCLCAYKILKLMKNTIYIELVHRREEPEPGATTTWKPYGTPLVFPVSTDATITRGDMQLIVHTMLSPMLKKVKSETDISSVISNPLCDNNSSEPDSIHKENSKSLLKLPLKLVDENDTPLDISAGKDKTICFSSSSMPILLFIDWSPELLKIYETCYLENLPKVFKDGYGTKKESLSLYTCIEAFLSEEPLVLEDMWFCSHCKERRQASKKLDLWRLPQVLVIHLKRFSYSGTVKNKLDTFVNFPLHDFDLTNYVANKNNCPQVYELYALANHYGSMGRGHYTADTKVRFINGKRWFNFDDSRVSAINEEDVKSNAAYVLFYRRVNKTDYSSTRNRASNGVHDLADQKFCVRG